MIRSPDIPHIAVIGPGNKVSSDLLVQAREVGRLLAARGAIVLTGGLGGVMEAASRGAYEVGGTTVGLLPGTDRSEGNTYLSVTLPTGLGEMRNALLVRSADAVIAVGCSWGTLSEVALAVRTGVPIVAIDCWDLPDGGPLRVAGPVEAVSTILGGETLRIGTWNLDRRHQPAQVDLLLELRCDVLLLTEVSPHLEIPGYVGVLTAGVMGRGQHWAGVFSRRPSEALPEPHPASAAARIDGRVFCSSILPWAGCGSGEPWGTGSHADKTRRSLDQLRESLRPDWVWGGDWNHALAGREAAGSIGGRLALREVLDVLDMQVPTANLPHRLDGRGGIDHIAVPGSWRVLSADRVSATREGKRLSDHDAYVVEAAADAPCAWTRRRMTVDRRELHDLVDELPDDQVAGLLADARRRARRGSTGAWPPEFFSMGSSKDGRTDTSERVDEILAEGFGEN